MSDFNEILEAAHQAAWYYRGEHQLEAPACACQRCRMPPGQKRLREMCLFVEEAFGTSAEEVLAVAERLVDFEQPVQGPGAIKIYPVGRPRAEEAGRAS